VLFGLWVKGNGLHRVNFDFLKLVNECFMKHQSMSQAWMGMEQESKCMGGQVPECVVLQVDALHCEPFEECVLQSFFVLDV